MVTVVIPNGPPRPVNPPDPSNIAATAVGEEGFVCTDTGKY